MLSRAATPALRRGFSTTSRKWSGFDPNEANPDFHMMFKRGNPVSFTLKFAIFCSTGFSAPFILARHQLMKK